MVETVRTHLDPDRAMKLFGVSTDLPVGSVRSHAGRRTRPLIRRLLLMACMVTTVAGCSGSVETTVFEVFGLDCRTDRFESVTNDFGAVVGLPSAADALAEFFDDEGQRFSALLPSDTDLGEMKFAYVDTDGLVQLTVQLTDEFSGYLVAGYSYCAD